MYAISRLTSVAVSFLLLTFVAALLLLTTTQKLFLSLSDKWASPLHILIPYRNLMPGNYYPVYNHLPVCHIDWGEQFSSYHIVRETCNVMSNHISATIGILVQDRKIINLTMVFHDLDIRLGDLMLIYGHPDKSVRGQYGYTVWIWNAYHVIAYPLTHQEYLDNPWSMVKQVSWGGKREDAKLTLCMIQERC